MSIPPEIWKRIFSLAVNDGILFQPGIPTALTESAWWKNYRGCSDPLYKWKLTSPEQATDILQRRSYATKKVFLSCFISYADLRAHQAIISTCTQWRQIGDEVLFQCLYFTHVAKVFGPNSTAMFLYGQWTKKIHIGPYIFLGTDSLSVEEYQEGIIRLIRHCPNVELFIVQRPLGSSFGPIMDALVHFSRHLHTVHLHIPGESVSKVICGLSSLPCIVAARIDVETNASATEDFPYLRLPNLQQIFLRGYVDTLLGRLAGCDLPSLRSFSLGNGTSIRALPTVEEFLKHHRSKLVLLDLKIEVNVPLVLDLCPNVDTLAFNADLRIEPHDDAASNVVNRPHQLSTIGLHGLRYAFGVGTLYSQTNSSQAAYTARSNDLNMGALNKDNFPNLRRIRAVNRSLLEDLNQSNRPSRENGGYDRWLKWWSTCADAAIRLEDCTGQLLGTLPDIEEGEDNEEEVDSEEEDEATQEDGFYEEDG